jgi:hypothetical protein
MVAGVPKDVDHATVQALIAAISKIRRDERRYWIATSGHGGPTVRRRSVGPYGPLSIDIIGLEAVGLWRMVTGMPKDMDHATVQALIAEISKCETPMEIALHPLSAFQLAGLVQLALRHPGVSDHNARTGRAFVELVRSFFTTIDAPAIVDVLDRGDDPTEDFQD